MGRGCSAGFGLDEGDLIHGHLDRVLPQQVADEGAHRVGHRHRDAVVRGQVDLHHLRVHLDRVVLGDDEPEERRAAVIVVARSAWCVARRLPVLLCIAVFCPSLYYV